MSGLHVDRYRCHLGLRQSRSFLHRLCIHLHHFPVRFSLVCIGFQLQYSFLSLYMLHFLRFHMLHFQRHLVSKENNSHYFNFRLEKRRNAQNQGCFIFWYIKQSNNSYIINKYESSNLSIKALIVIV